MYENVSCSCCPGREEEGSAVFFSAWQTGSLFNGGYDGNIVFQNSESSKGFCFANGVLTVFAPGVYAVDYGVYVPAGTALDTTFYLKANGRFVPSVTVRAEHGASAPSEVYSARAVIRVGCSPLSLALLSSETPNYSVSDASALASISVIRIGG